MADRWYVAQLKPNGFEKAQINLARQGFETFMPVRETSTRHARRVQTKLKPIFSGYIFIRFGDDRADWRKINSTLGIARLVSFEKNTPAPVPDALMAGLRARCGEDGQLLPMTDLKIGERVKLVAGAFVSFVGEIEDLVNENRVRILFEFMGQKTRVDAEPAALERL